jgi:hypothetical protein
VTNRLNLHWYFAFIPHSRGRAYQGLMPARSFPLAALVAFAIFAPGVAGAAEYRCLDKEQQRAATASGKAVRLASALRAARVKAAGEVVKARLCESPKGLVYRLTLLARDGKVTRVSVDAASGNVVSGL